MKVRRIVTKIVVMLLISALALVALFWIWMNPLGLFTLVAPGITEEKWSQVSNGMTLDEVLRILPPPLEKIICNEYSGCKYFLQYSRPREPFFLYRNIRVFFDEEDKVINKLDEIDDDKTW